MSGIKTALRPITQTFASDEREGIRATNCPKARRLLLFAPFGTPVFSRATPNIDIQSPSLRAAPMSSVDLRSARLSELAHSEAFIHRHIGPDAEHSQAILKQLGVNSLTELLDHSLTESIRSTNSLDLGPPMTEHQARS